MKRLILILALPLAACAANQSVPSSLQPSTYSDQTKVDEQSAQTAELAYKAWRLAIKTGVQGGIIKGQTAKDIADIDNKLYAALQTVESAYATANSASIQSAVSNFNALLTQANALVGSK